MEKKDIKNRLQSITDKVMQLYILLQEVKTELIELKQDVHISDLEDNLIAKMSEN